MTEAIGHIGHFQIRNRGTTHRWQPGPRQSSTPLSCPPSARRWTREFVVADSNGTQTMAASEFAIGPLITSLAPRAVADRSKAAGAGGWLALGVPGGEPPGG